MKSISQEIFPFDFQTPAAVNRVKQLLENKNEFVSIEIF